MDGIEYFMGVLILFGAVLGWAGHMIFVAIFNPIRDAYHTSYVLPAIQKLVKALRTKSGFPAKEASNLLKAVEGIYKDTFGFQRAHDVAEMIYRQELGVSDKKSPSLEIELAENFRDGRLLTLTWPGLKRPFTLAVK